MNNPFHIFLILLAGSSVAIADIFIKKIAVGQTDFWAAMRHPYIIPVVLLYIAQIMLFCYVFVKKWDLGIVGILQMALYSLIVVATGVFYFKERLTPVHGIGMVLAVAGAICMNL